MKKIVLLLFLAVAAQVATAQIKILYGPYLQNVKDAEATIVWEADKPSVGWVELAPDDGTHFYGEERPKFFDTTNGVKNTSLLHSVKIKGLKPATTYRYRIYSQEVLSHEGISVIYGRVAASDVYKKKPLTFTTCDPDKPDMSFLMINDIHGRENIITKLLNAADYKKKDLIIFNGDMVSEFKDRETIFNGFMKESIDLFASEQPMYYARGNHETRGEFATSFQNYFSPKEPFLYYVFKQGPVCFIMLDTGEDKPDSDIEYSGITDYDGYRTEQMEWMKTLRDNKDFQQARFKVVIAHMPPSKEPGIWHGQKDVLDKFVPILNEIGVDLMLCGHLHRNVYEEPSSLIKFPVLVNSNNSVVSVKTEGNQLNLEVLDLDGKVVTKKSYSAK
ncbi:FN3 domain-containing metallophosphoesterase family protein [Massilibacteroides sp.]|uniref:FN3 domain-containing metallophosphoesterase family protein n=1 Tax=Massilibacteroides sp. TaxID=2034766 RepID=UPI0026237949|nr:FN3 domain-containing metallophosphoesterase family protein [Massilibacteroides sp.]MDD4514303.1 FN3 domain-containing metallophosphoesterase family protein [Massilibacteroides sp.]